MNNTDSTDQLLYRPLAVFSGSADLLRFRDRDNGSKSRTDRRENIETTERRFTWADLLELPTRMALALARAQGFFAIVALALADAVAIRIVAVPTAIAMAHARALWLHRWSRAARWVLGVQFERQGVMPVSGMVTANYSFFLDAILLAAMRPCVFVVGSEVRRWPAIGLLARLGGTLFVDPKRRGDVARVNFLIERAVRRRLLVVIFPECGRPDGERLLPFASGLFQPAVDLGCSLTAAAFSYRGDQAGDGARLDSHGDSFLYRFTQLIFRRRTQVTAAFRGPGLHQGNRKELAEQLRAETLGLFPGSVMRGGATAG